MPARVVLLGVGAGSPQDVRRAGAALARAARGRDRVVTDLAAPSWGRRTPSPDDESVRAAVEGLLLGGWSPPASGLKDRSDSRPATEILLDPAAARGRRRARPGARRRHAACPCARGHPLGREDARLDGRRGPAGRRGRRARRRGLGRAAPGGGGLRRAAGGGRRERGPTPAGAARVPPGARRPPAGTAPGARIPQPVVLVGKGITFDTGGLAVKPREAMLPMRTDMSGAGAVLAVLAACRAARRPPSRDRPAAARRERRRGASYRPGDVVRQYGGRTVEVVNTDAEGRVVLADAMAYAVEHLDPDRRRRRGHADRRGLAGPRPPARAPSTPRRRPGRRSRRRRRGRRRAGVADAARRGLPPGDRLGGGRRTAGRDRARVRRRLDHRRTVPARVRGEAGAGRTSTSPGRRGPTGTSTRCPRGPPASARGSSCDGWSSCSGPGQSASTSHVVT